MIQKFGDDSVAFPDSFGAMSETERNWLRRRLTIENFFRRSTNLGLGAFSLAVLLLALSAFCLRSAGLIYETHTKLEQDSIEATLLSEQEPQDQSYHFAVTAMVLSQLDNIDIKPVTQCLPKSQSCAAQRQIHKVLQELWSLVDRPLTSDTTSGQDTPAASHPTSATLSEHVKATFLQEGMTEAMAAQLTKDFLDMLDTRERAPRLPPEMQTCPAPPPGASSRSLDFDFAGCMRASPPYLTDVLLPAQLRLSRIDQAANTIPDPPHAPGYDARVLAEASDSRVFDFALLVASLKRPGVFDGAADTADDGPQLVQAYFVSIDSVLRIWSRDQSNIGAQLPRQRLWGQASYLQEFWRHTRTDSYQTRPYLDMGRNGIVWSICDPLDLRYPAAMEAKFVGVVCYDFALPDGRLAEIQKHLDLLPMISASLIEVPIAGGGSFGAATVSFVQPSSELNVSGIAALRRDLETYIRRANAGDLYTSVQTIDLSEEGKRAYLVPLGLANGKLSAFVIQAEPHHVPLALLLLACIGTSGLALTLGLWVVGFRASKRLSDADSNIARLRGLPVGVLETDDVEVIVSANDRAEELIEAELPQSGERVGKPVRYSDVFDLTMLYEDDSSDNGSSLVRQVRRINYEDVLERRRKGDSSTYYVPLKKAKATQSSQPKPTAWFRVTASPVLPHSTVTERSTPKVRVATFGVFAELLSGERIALEEAIRRLPGNSSSNSKPTV